MSRSVPERWPISSRRRVKSGISTRERMRRRTLSAASASRRTGSAMVPASRIDSTIMTPAATRKTFMMASRSASTMSSMSAPCVDSISAPRTARNRCTGTATETMTSPRSLMRTMLASWPFERLRHFGIALAVVGAEFVIKRQIAPAEPAAHGDESALEQARLFRGRRRQVETQHVAAAEQIAAVDQQHAVAVVDARARLGRRHQPPQDRRDPLRIDRKIDAVERVFVRAVAFARLQIEQFVGIERDRGIGLDRRRRRDRAGDDLALHQQALDARVDQPGAELRQKDDADRERDQAGDVEDDDAAGEARRALRDEELPGALRPVAEPGETVRAGAALSPRRSLRRSGRPRAGLST